VKAEAIKISNLTGHQGAIYALEQGPEPGMVFSAGADKLITAWDLYKKENVPFLARLPSAVYSLCYIREKELLLAGTSDGSIHVIDLRNSQELKILKHHTAPVFCLSYSLKYDSIYSIAADGHLAHVSLNTLSLIRLRKIIDAKLRQTAFSPSGTEMAIACGDGSIRLFRLEDLTEKTRISAHQQSANSVCYHPSGKYLLSGGKDAHLNVWNLEKDPVLEHSVPAHNFAIYKIVFSPNSHLFATASRDKTIKLWDASTYAFLLRISSEIQGGHVNSVNTLLWAQEPPCLVSAGDDRSLMLWDIRS
jgi:WD repeat-containing protein 61